MKATAKAPANIAFIKYWGKTDNLLRLPLNDSVSMNMSGAYTITTVEFSDRFTQDDVTMLGGNFSKAEEMRVILGLDRIREKAGSNQKAKVVTKNTFPKGAGSAASASGFAALTVSGFAALGISLSERELTVFARLGSGSACRSIPDGFVVWEKGDRSENSYAYSLFPADHWDIRDILVIVDRRMKKVSTTEGMETVASSPRLDARLSAIPRRMRAIVESIREKNFARFGEITEEDCLDMHAVMQTQVPPLLYWNETTNKIMQAVADWRKAGIPVYFTIDAGPNVHVLCQGQDEGIVRREIQKIHGIEDVIVNRPDYGTRVIPDHLF